MVWLGSLLIYFVLDAVFSDSIFVPLSVTNQGKSAWADTLGVAFDCLSRLRVSSACGSSLSQRCVGKDLSTPDRMERKWFLKSLIPISTKFLLWHHGGASSNMYSDFMSSFILSEHSLSMACFFTSTPACFSLLISAR